MKKFWSLFLAVSLLLTAALLSACGEDGDSTSSKEEVKEPTKAEQLEKVFDNLESRFAELTERVGLSAEDLLAESGTCAMEMSLDRLELLGTDELGGEPLAIRVDGAGNDDLSKASATFSVAGDDIVFDYYVSDGQIYVLFPDLFGDTVFDATTPLTDTETDEETDAAENEFDISDLMTAVSDWDAVMEKAFGDEDAVESLITLTESEGKKTFTVAVTDEQTKAFYEAMGVPADSQEITSLTLTVVSENDMLQSLTLVTNTEDTLRLTVTDSETQTVMNAVMESEGAAVTEITLTMTESNAVLAFEVSAEGYTFDGTLTATKATDSSATFEGTVNMVIPMEGMSLTIPMTLSGEITETDSGAELSLGLALAISGMMDLEMHFSMAVTPDEVTVSLPFDPADVSEFDKEEFVGKMIEVYPNAAMFMGYASTGSDAVYAGFITAEQDLELYLYETGGMDIYSETLQYEDTGDSWELYYGDVLLLELPYEKDGDVYTLYGEEAELYEGMLMADVFYDDSYLTVALCDENTAFLYLQTYAINTDDGMLIPLPDGSTVEYTMGYSEDGGITFCGIPMYMIDTET